MARVNDVAVAKALASARNDVRRLWEVNDPHLRALHRGRVEGALEALLTLGVISVTEASDVRESIGTAIEHTTD